MTWLAPKEITDKYAKRCLYYSQNDWSNFKQDKEYNTVLEGNEIDVGLIAWNGIEKLGGLRILLDYLSAFKENEKVGNPRTYHFRGIEIAPSTLRYVNTALEIQTLVKDPKRIVEIGGGYGGLCKTMSVLQSWDSYKIIDIPEAVKLCDRYLKHFNLNAEAVEEFDGESDLVIADSSIAECNWETQKKYVELIKKAKYAYIVYNTLHLEENRQCFWKLLNELLPVFDMRIEHTYHSNGTKTIPILILYLKR